jgi:hypothetical protein
MNVIRQTSVACGSISSANFNEGLIVLMVVKCNSIDSSQFDDA